jgi:hypothetical protein
MWSIGTSEASEAGMIAFVFHCAACVAVLPEQVGASDTFLAGAVFYNKAGAGTKARADREAMSFFN